jgi:hypothetical protein
MNRLKERLDDLKTEFESGQKLLAGLEAQRVRVGETLLRISGAIQVLQELMDGQEQDHPSANGDTGAQMASVQRSLPIESAGRAESPG